MKKIPIVCFNTTAEQIEKIKQCYNFACFEIVKDVSKDDNFYVFVNGVDVAKDFLNLMLWGKQLYKNDDQCYYIDSFTPIKEALPKGAADKVFIRPHFFGIAYGGWLNRSPLVYTPAERDLIQKKMDSEGKFVVSPFVSRIADGVSSDPWIDGGGYKSIGKNGFHFNN